MKKLVASDMDGTLMPYGTQRISKTFFDVIKELNKLNVVFAAASGRQLPSLKMLFESVEDDIVFIAENGALVVYKGEIILEKTMSPVLAHEIIKDVMRIPGCDPIVSVKDTVYISQACDDYFRARESEILYTTTVTDDFFSIDEGVLKITACNYDGIRENASYFAKNWGKFAEVTVSGPIYCDFMDPSVSKGNALSKIMDLLNLKPEECIAFGDNYNDISMLDCVENSFAMKNADDTVKEHARYQTDNVEDTIRKIYNIKN